MHINCGFVNEEEEIEKEMPAFRFNSPGKVGKHAIKEGTKEVVQRKARV